MVFDSWDVTDKLVRLGCRALLVVVDVVRMVLCALFVLLEPLLRATLVPLAYLSFLVTMIFGFLMGDPHFPKWGMLAFALGALCLYWVFLWVMSLFVGVPRGRD